MRKRKAEVCIAVLIRVQYLGSKIYIMVIHGHLCCCFVLGMLFLRVAGIERAIERGVADRLFQMCLV